MGSRSPDPAPAALSAPAPQPTGSTAALRRGHGGRCSGISDTGPAGPYDRWPLDDRFHERLLQREGRERTSFTFYPGAVRIPEGSAPNTTYRSYSVMAGISISAGGAEGPICTIGGTPAGRSLYIKDGKLVYCHNYAGVAYYYVRSGEDLPSRATMVRFEFEKTGTQQYGAGGVGRLFVIGQQAGEAEIPRSIPFRYTLDETFDVGCDTGTAVSPEYCHGAKFTGKVNEVYVEVGPGALEDREMATKHAMMRQ